jgi:hypothetical protein
MDTVELFSGEDVLGGNSFAHRQKNRAPNVALALKRGTRHEYLRKSASDDR